MNVVSLTFLGTSAGIAPTLTRACTASVLDFGIYSCLLDCAEGTQRQLLFLRERIQRFNERGSSGPSMRSRGRGRGNGGSGRTQHPNHPVATRLPDRSFANIKRIFITHLHLDHIMGLPVLLTFLIANSNPGSPTSPERAPIEIFGPSGLRNLIRSILTLTSTAAMNSMDVKYRVHELVRPTDPITTCSVSALHPSEMPGRDILCNRDGLWPGFTEAHGSFEVSAGPIEHRAFCLGYVFTELPSPSYNLHHQSPPPTPRKIVYLGDTSDPSALSSLAESPSLLVHESTLAYIPKSISGGSSKKGSTEESMRQMALDKGHSTPGMAGAFAKSIGAENLVLNHFSARYPHFAYGNGRPSAVMAEIERLASVAWGRGKARAAHDFLRAEISQGNGNGDVAHIRWTSL